MAEYVQILRQLEQETMEQWGEGGKVDMLVSVAQVLSPLELALIIWWRQQRRGGVQTIRIEPIMLLAE